MFKRTTLKLSHLIVRMASSESFPYTLEKSMNRVQLLGRVGQDPVMRNLDGRNSVTVFSVATNETWKQAGNDGAGSGEITQKTSWHRISVFRPGLRNLAYEYIKKGSRVYVEGRLDYAEYVDKYSTKRQATNILADHIIFLTDPHKDEEE
uniref:single-stranded DNA-binding protein, mitochondrial n=1 Tax=Myxine glutinosa TaxID=7769 RepID=UPI0035901D72